MTPERVAPPAIGGVFSTQDAFAAGWTADAARHAVATGRWRRLRPGSFVAAQSPADDDQPFREARRRLLQASIATAVHSDAAVLSHASAAVAEGLPLLPGAGRSCLSVPNGVPTSALAGVHLHRAALPADQLLRFRGITATSAARTALDVAREHGIESGLAAADAALRFGLCSTAELASVAELCGGWPWGKRAVVVAAMADAAAESPLESVSRVRLRRAGLPTPRLQQDIFDERGCFVARVDFYWDDVGVIGEADGAAKYDGGRQVLLEERRRQQELEDLGLVIVRWGWPDLARFSVVIRRFERAFSRGLRRGDRERRWALPR